MFLYILLLAIPSTDMFGGPRDRPIVFKGGGCYNLIWKETYWKDVLGNDFKFEDAVGGFLRIDLVLARFSPPKTHKYSKEFGFMEFIRRTHEFMAPKGFFNGYNFGLYTLTGSAQPGDIRAQIIPIGISLGLFAGESPWFPYYTIGGGAGLVSENWKNLDSTKIEPTGSTSSTAWYVRPTVGIIRELKNEFALDVSLSFDYLAFAHSKGQEIPGNPDEIETIQKFTAEIGLVFALPLIREETIW